MIDRIPALARDALNSLVHQIRDTEQKIAAFNNQILAMAKENEVCRRLTSVLTIGPFASTAFWRQSVTRIISPMKELKGGIGAFAGCFPGFGCVLFSFRPIG